MGMGREPRERGISIQSRVTVLYLCKWRAESGDGRDERDQRGEGDASGDWGNTWERGTGGSDAECGEGKGRLGLLPCTCLGREHSGELGREGREGTGGGAVISALGSF